MNREQAVALVKKYGSENKAVRAAGCSRWELRSALGKEVLKSARPAGGATAKPAIAARPVPAGGRSLAEFRNTYDKNTIVPAKIKTALRQLGSGWEYEVAFAKMAGVGLAELGQFREQFVEHVVQIGRDARRAWAGTKATAEAMRRML